MAPITPCLWFDVDADEAVDHYLSIFPDARRLADAPADGPPPPAVEFELCGTRFLALNGGPEHGFTPSVSFVVGCAIQAEVDHYWDRLVEGGEPSRCGWLTDRFGVSWQIVPDRLGELLGDPDPGRAGRALQAMLQMSKIDVAALEAAADGG
jgi:predicted 3-demethylubiquinone-9 3-methyltransferase (glyoxalase superfamily)